jgi:hypothetical protein
MPDAIIPDPAAKLLQAVDDLGVELAAIDEAIDAIPDAPATFTAALSIVSQALDLLQEGVEQWAAGLVPQPPTGPTIAEADDEGER